LNGVADTAARKEIIIPIICAIVSYLDINLKLSFCLPLRL